MEFTLTYDLDDAGWAEMNIENAEGETNITISYLRDSLRELAEAAKEIGSGANSAEVVFMDEPGHTTLVLNRVDDLLKYEVRWYDPYYNREFKVKLSGETTPARFVSEVKKELRVLFDEYGEAGYIQKWIGHKFPYDLMRELEKIDDIRSSLEKMKACEQEGRKLSEIDTQALLVERVLDLADYDVCDLAVVCRASRSPTTSEFDVEVFKDGELFLAIEVKALSSGQFNIDKRNIGRLTNVDGKWKNRDGDGVGQLRRYCLNWKDRLTRNTIPILTNGERWCLFKSEEFIDEDKAGDFFDIDDSVIQASVGDESFERKIIDYIRC